MKQPLCQKCRKGGLKLVIFVSNGQDKVPDGQEPTSHQRVMVCSSCGNSRKTGHQGDPDYPFVGFPWIEVRYSNGQDYSKDTALVIRPGQSYSEVSEIHRDPSTNTWKS